LLGVWNEIQEAVAVSDPKVSTRKEHRPSTYLSVGLQTMFDFDLIYAPRTWQTIFTHWNHLANAYDLLYLHTGGVEGNASQLFRYSSMQRSQ